MVRQELSGEPSVPLGWTPATRYSAPFTWRSRLLAHPKIDIYLTRDTVLPIGALRHSHIQRRLEGSPGLCVLPPTWKRFCWSEAEGTPHQRIRPVRNLKSRVQQGGRIDRLPKQQVPALCSLNDFPVIPAAYDLNTDYIHASMLQDRLDVT